MRKLEEFVLLRLIRKAGFAVYAGGQSIPGGTRKKTSTARDKRRPVYDTNGDGQVDDSDACMQVGGQFVTILDSREIVEFLTEEGHADLINGGRP